MLLVVGREESEGEGWENRGLGGYSGGWVAGGRGTPSLADHTHVAQTQTWAQAHFSCLKIGVLMTEAERRLVFQAPVQHGCRKNPARLPVTVDSHGQY